MQTYLNETGVPLSVAVYLATDTYDFIPNTISATGLMKSTRQHVLTSRVPMEQRAVDVTSVTKSRIGTAIHDGIERAWKEDNYKKAMRLLGYDDAVINRIVVNPEGELAPDAIPVYMEIRSFKEIDGFNVSGKFDFVAEGRVEDFKSTSTFTWVKGAKTEDYQIQGSIYRWLNPELITEGYIAIQFFFTDWMPGRAKMDPKYPQRIVEQLKVPLLTLPETEAYIRNKLALITKYKDAPEVDIPICTDKELWRHEPAWKYYKNPEKRARSTKNFDNADEAYARLMKDSSVGVVVEIPGEVVACRFCSAFNACTQKDAYLANGTLKL